MLESVMFLNDSFLPVLCTACYTAEENCHFLTDLCALVTFTEGM